ncbi:MAG: hypothetical protein JST19_05195 [Bacteroidetes bacterium]|nr:hypothetical protein [Bacteroidota bacterium]
MLTRDGLVEEISKTITKTKVGKLTAILDKQQFALRDLIDITFYGDSNIAFRAAWILENLFLKKPETYANDLEYLLSRVKDVTYPSCQRHYAKIMMHITGKKVPLIIRGKLEGTDLEPIVEKLFDWLIDPNMLVAVKVFASEALFNLRHRYPWITQELKEQLKFLMRDGSAAIQTRGRKLLAKL